MDEGARLSLAMPMSCFSCCCGDNGSKGWLQIVRRDSFVIILYETVYDKKTTTIVHYS